MVIEISQKELLEQCIRCQSISNLSTYTIRATMGKRILRNYDIKYSVCEKCRFEHEKSLKIENRRLYKRYEKWFCIISPILMVIIFLYTFNLLLYFGLLAFCFLGIYSLNLYYKHHPKRLNKVFKINSNGEILIKHPISSDLIKRIIINLPENEINDSNQHKYKFCPQCGAKSITDLKFCPQCGKNLLKL